MGVLVSSREHPEALILWRVKQVKKDRHKEMCGILNYVGRFRMETAVQPSLFTFLPTVRDDPFDSCTIVDPYGVVPTANEHYTVSILLVPSVERLLLDKDGNVGKKSRSVNR